MILAKILRILKLRKDLSIKDYNQYLLSYREQYLAQSNITDKELSDFHQTVLTTKVVRDTWRGTEVTLTLPKLKLLKYKNLDITLQYYSSIKICRVSEAVFNTIVHSSSVRIYYTVCKNKVKLLIPFTLHKLLKMTVFEVRTIVFNVLDSTKVKYSTKIENFPASEKFITSLLFNIRDVHLHNKVKQQLHESKIFNRQATAHT